ncbi:unnamed protein product, partial [Effrenium voratum]
MSVLLIEVLRKCLDWSLLYGILPLLCDEHALARLEEWWRTRLGGRALSRGALARGIGSVGHHLHCPGEDVQGDYLLLEVGGPHLRCHRVS